MSRNRKAKNINAKSNYSASYLVGYVEDEETPEMIAKKFEMMEKLEKEEREREEKERQEKEESIAVEADGSSSDLPMADVKDEDQKGRESDAENARFLERVFKQTSQFTLDSANNRQAFEQAEQAEDVGFFTEEFGGIDSDSAEYQESEAHFFDDEDDYQGTLEDESEHRGKRKRPTQKAPAKQGAPSLFGSHGGLIKKIVKKVDPWEINFVRVPANPIPISMARIIENYTDPQKKVPGNIYVEMDLMRFVATEKKKKVDLSKFVKEKKREIIGILMDPPWYTKWTPHLEFRPPMLLEMGMEKVMDKGFVFMWVEKELISEVCFTMEKLGFVYVENLIWIKRKIDNEALIQPSTYFNKSKVTLFIFRKKEGKNSEGLELRHQRNPDVCFDFVRKDKALTEDKPSFVYRVIETLLPTGNYNAKSDQGQFMELWCKKDNKRKGWIGVAHKDEEDEMTDD